MWARSVRNKSSLGDMHTSKRKNKGHEILRGSAKAYIHGVHPHSTHTMKSIITIVKYYLSQLSQFSHFSTWHSTPLVNSYNENYKSIYSFTFTNQLPPTPTYQVHQPSSPTPTYQVHQPSSPTTTKLRQWWLVVNLVGTVQLI